MRNLGKYVVIEGNDGTGKSTQVEMLSEWLNKENGIETFVTHEPAGAPIADAIREVIKNGELERSPETNLLLFTATRYEIWQQARRELALGRWVLSARNYLSTEVYQGYAEGLSIELIHDITRQFTDDRYMSPDYTFILTLDDDERKRCIGGRGELAHKDTFESRDDEFQSKLNAGYVEIAKKYDFTTIDAGDSIVHIQQTLRDHILKER